MTSRRRRTRQIRGREPWLRQLADTAPILTPAERADIVRKLADPDGCAALTDESCRFWLAEARRKDVT